MISKLWNIWWTQWTWPLKLVSAVAVLALLLLPFVLMRGCGKPSKLDEQEIQRGEQAVKDRNDRELKEILINSEVREKLIEANVANAREATAVAVQEAREKYANMNTSELAAELEKRK